MIRVNLQCTTSTPRDSLSFYLVKAVEVTVAATLAEKVVTRVQARHPSMARRLRSQALGVPLALLSPSPEKQPQQLQRTLTGVESPLFWARIVSLAGVRLAVVVGYVDVGLDRLSVFSY